MAQQKDGATVLLELAEAKGVTSAIIGGGLAYATLGLTPVQALSFGAGTALATSTGDLLLTYAGVSSKVDSYLNAAGVGSFVDVNDFVAGGVGGLAFAYALGYESSELAMAAGIMAVGAGLAPMVSSSILLKIAPIPQSK